MTDLATGADAGKVLSCGGARVSGSAVLGALALLAPDLLLPAEAPRLGAPRGGGPPACGLVRDLGQEGSRLPLPGLLVALPEEAGEELRCLNKGFVPAQHTKREREREREQRWVSSKRK